MNIGKMGRLAHSTGHNRRKMSKENQLTTFIWEKLHHFVINWTVGGDQLLQRDSAHLWSPPVCLLRVFARLEKRLGAVSLKLEALALLLPRLLRVDVLRHPALVR